MITIGLTGGIGSGKSTVAAMLARRGALVVDADQLAREAVEPGRPAFEQVVERFGPGIVLESGELDRPALAAVVFADGAARRDLEAIVHPEVGRLIAEHLLAATDTDHVVVLDIPLLVEGAGPERYGLAGVLVVDTPVDVALDRLVRRRKMDRADVERRMAAQAAREDRLRRADFVILNTGSMEELELMVDRAWAWMSSLAAGGDTGP